MTVACDIENTLSPFFAKGLALWMENGALRFKAPKELLTPELIALLKQEKESIQHWLVAQEDNGQTSEPIDSFPLASTQAAIWMLYQFAPTNAAYNTAFACVLSDEYQLEHIKQALHGVFIRHPMLRTTFEETKDGARQQVWKNVDLPLLIESGSDWDESELIRRIAEAADKPFNLALESCLRINLFKNTIRGDVMVATIHHIGADLWALLIIAKELSDNYQMLVNGDALTVKPLSNTYQIHVDWQQNYLLNEKGKQARTFWKQQLRGVPLDTTITPDFQRPAVLTMKSKFHQFVLPDSYSRRIRKYCKAASVTPFVLMQLVFQCLIARESNRHEFLIGTPTMGRNARGMDQIVGDFANPVILRAKLDFDKTIADLLAVVKQDLQGVMEYQDYPFPNVVQDCNPPRDPSRTPLFQLMFIWHQGDTSLLENSDLVKEVLPESGPRGTPYDVMLAVSDLADTFELNWTFQESLYKEDTIERLAQRYTAMLELILNLDSGSRLPHFDEELTQVKEQFCLTSIDPSLPERNALYIYYHADRIDRVFKQLYVQGDAFNSRVLHSAFDEIIFVHQFPYTDTGKVDSRRLSNHASINTRKLEEALGQVGIAPNDWHVSYKQSLLPAAAFCKSLPPKKRRAKPSVSNSDTEAKRPLAHVVGKQWIINDSSLKNLPASLKQTANRNPNQGIVFSDGDNLKSKYRYCELYQDAKQVAANLLHSDLSNSDIILLQMQVTSGFLAMWWGIVIAGIKPLVIAKPDMLDRENSLGGKLYNVATSMCGLSVISDDDVATKTAKFLGGSIPVSGASALLETKSGISPLSDKDLDNKLYDSVVFLQLTSGSTGTPKAIQMTHEGVLHHVHAVAAHNIYEDSDITLNWLPFDHVVPLLTTHIKDVVLGVDQIQLPTKIVLSNPWVWLEAISNFRVTHSWAPNFGFQSIVDTLESLDEIPDIDLTCLKKLMNAGEQVLRSTVKSFTSILSPFGLDAAAVQPAFGMAECCTCITYNNKSNDLLSLQVTDKDKTGTFDIERHKSEGITFVDLGDLIPGVQIRITNTNNQTLREGDAGRLQIKGPMVTPGYLRNDEANQEAFVGDGWFNSGDLGFIWNSRLYLTGREKEMIVIHGANQYCYDIEKIAASISDIESGFVAAVGVSKYQEKNDDELAIFYVPVDSNVVASINHKIAAQISERTGLVPAYTIPVDKKGFYKTTSGKIQRGKFKKKFQDGAYQHAVSSSGVTHASAAVPHRYVFAPQWQFIEVVDKTIIPSENIFTWPVGIWNKATGQQLVKTLLFKYIDNHKMKPFVIDMGAISSSFTNKAWFDVVRRYSCIKSVLRELDINTTFTLVHQSKDKYVCTLIRPLIETLRLESLLSSIGCVVADKDAAWVPSQCHGIEDILWFDKSDRFQKLLFKSVIEKPSQIANPKTPIQMQGTYVITGGLGGLGVAMAKVLMTHYDASVILLGRRQLEPKSRAQLRFRALQAEYDDTDLAYTAIDTANVHQIESILSKALKNSKGDAIDGIFHLAGMLENQDLDEIDEEEWNNNLSAKVNLSRALAGYLSKHFPESIFVQFSSVNSFLGGRGAGAYSFANAYQTVLHEELSQCTSIKSWCIHWSAWRSTGMAKGFSFSDLRMAENKGFIAFDPVFDAHWLEDILLYEPGDYFIGLDANNECIEQHIDGYTNGLNQVQIHIVKPMGTEKIDAIEKAVFGSVRDPFSMLGQKAIEIILHDKPFPVDGNGKINIQQLVHTSDTSHDLGKSPENALEQAIADIWSHVLDVDVNDINRSFFEYGGHSIAATKIVTQLNAHFGESLAVSMLFQYPTIKQLAAKFGERVPLTKSLALQDTANQRLDVMRVEKVKAASSGNPAFTKTIILMPTCVGLPSAYLELVARFQGNADIVAVSLPEMGSHPSSLNTMEYIGANVAKALLSSDVDLSRAILLGWSYGGVLSYEVSKNIEKYSDSVPGLIMLDSGFSDGLHAITFDERFQEVMFASELGLLSALIPEFSSLNGLENRLNWLSQSLKEQQIDLSPKALKRWWIIFKARLDSLLHYSPQYDLKLKANIHFITAAQHPHGRDDLGWKAISNNFKHHSINTDHQGIVKSQMTVDWIQHHIAQGA